MVQWNLIYGSLIHVPDILYCLSVSNFIYFIDFYLFSYVWFKLKLLFFFFTSFLRSKFRLLILDLYSFVKRYAFNANIFCLCNGFAVSHKFCYLSSSLQYTLYFLNSLKTSFSTHCCLEMCCLICKISYVNFS